tara:strand:+ start:1337 stop:1603 length:267 start_codon:yes stop_codon:yes gene_type:complete|eukprot:scaffold28756_cov59-Phaeocystis_antarctica.AAC.10
MRGTTTTQVTTIATTSAREVVRFVPYAPRRIDRVWLATVERKRGVNRLHELVTAAAAHLLNPQSIEPPAVHDEVLVVMYVRAPPIHML